MPSQAQHQASVSASAATFMAHAYQPILRGYFRVACVYYAIMVVAHGLTLMGERLAIMATASLIGCAGCALGAWMLRKPQSSVMLEAVTAAVNFVVIGNVMAGLHVEFAQAKLVYFVMMTMIFAFACASVRQALLSIIITFACLFFQLNQYAPEQLRTYGFIGLAAALAAIGITYFLRQTLAGALSERLAAEIRLDAAHRMGEAMRQQSLTDSLTGLANRRGFFDELSRCRDASSAVSDFWLILLDLDGFKAINDNHGHMIGDALLRAVAARLEAYCGASVHVSRIGGDEFNIILLDRMTDDDICAWCEKLLVDLNRSYIIEDRQILISASVGCCPSSAADTDAGLIQMADYALLHAKRTGRNRAVAFRDEHAQEAIERFHIEQAMRVADLDRELDLVFQPQYDLQRERIVGAEALVRWNSPTLGLVSPARFIVIAEECGLIADITLTVLDKLLARLKEATHPLPVSMNLSGHDLLSDETIDAIIYRVTNSGIDRQLLEFEITETAMMPDIVRASANVARLAAYGHSIALDDFGTGYSNLRYLRTLPISKLKVDRAFMEDAGDVMTEKLLRSIAGLARTLGVQCLFEGVETELELVLAKRAGAHVVQGYLIGAPMPWQHMNALVEDERAPVTEASPHQAAQMAPRVIAPTAPIFMATPPHLRSGSQ
jgi:diguanylate cyclase (GGDEF)-like protein